MKAYGLASVFGFPRSIAFRIMCVILLVPVLSMVVRPLPAASESNCTSYTSVQAPPDTFCTVPAGFLLSTQSDVQYRYSPSDAWTPITNYGKAGHDFEPLPVGPVEVWCQFGCTFRIDDQPLTDVGWCDSYDLTVAPKLSRCSVRPGYSLLTAADVKYRYASTDPWTPIDQYGVPYHDPVYLPTGPLEVGCEFGCSFEVMVPRRYPEPTPVLGNGVLQITGPEERVGSTWPNPPFRYLPDGNISMSKVGSETTTSLTADVSAYRMSGSNLDSLSPNSTAVLSPGGPGHFDADYAGPGSVVRSTNMVTLLMFYHAEDRQDGIDKARVSIGLATSNDEGKTWVKQGQILAGNGMPGTIAKFRGVGYPSVRKSPDGRYWYLYFVNWSVLDGVLDEICMARAPVESDGGPGNWMNYYNGQFDQNGLGGQCTPVIGIAHAESADSNPLFVANPSVSYNTQLGRYLALVTTRDGFFYTTSIDGIQWDNLQSLLRLDGNYPWYYFYDSFLSPDQDSQEVTSATGYLYYARRASLSRPHYMYRRPVSVVGTSPSSLYCSGTSGLTPLDPQQIPLIDAPLPPSLVTQDSLTLGYNVTASVCPEAAAQFKINPNGDPILSVTLNEVTVEISRPSPSNLLGGLSSSVGVERSNATMTATTSPDHLTNTVLVTVPQRVRYPSTAPVLDISNDVEVKYSSTIRVLPTDPAYLWAVAFAILQEQALMESLGVDPNTVISDTEQWASELLPLLALTGTGGAAPTPSTLAANSTVSVEPVPAQVVSDAWTVLGPDFVKSSNVTNLTVDGPTKQPGQVVAFSGSGFTPGHDVYVILAPPDALGEAITTSVRANDSGAISGAIQLPSRARTGRWLLAAVDNQTAYDNLKAYASGTTDTLQFYMAAANVNLTGPSSIYLPFVRR